MIREVVVVVVVVDDLGAMLNAKSLCAEELPDNRQASEGKVSMQYRTGDGGGFAWLDGGCCCCCFEVGRAESLSI